jgi:hypothetical protein
MDTFSKFLIPGVLFLLALAFGVWLSLAGKPYNGILFNIHKLVALAAVIMLSILIYQGSKSTGPHVILTILITLAILGVVALFATGALMSAGKLPYPTMLAIHRVAIILTTLALSGMVYLLIGRKP